MFWSEKCDLNHHRLVSKMSKYMAGFNIVISVQVTGIVTASKSAMVLHDVIINRFVLQHCLCLLDLPLCQAAAGNHLCSSFLPCNYARRQHCQG